MNCPILHDIPGRLRIHLPVDAAERASAREAYRRVAAQHGWLAAELSLHTGNLLVRYSTLIHREQVIAVLAAVELPTTREVAPETVGAVAPAEKRVAGKLASVGAKKLIGAVVGALCPAPLKPVLATAKAIPALFKTPELVSRLGFGNTLLLAAMAGAMTLVRRSSGIALVFQMAKTCRGNGNGEASQSAAPPLWVLGLMGLLTLVAPWLAKTLAVLLPLALPGIQNRQVRGRETVLMLPEPTYANTQHNIA